MAHIVLTGSVSPEDVFVAFKPLLFSEGNNQFKAEEVFLSQDKSCALVRSLTVERGYTKSFLVKVNARGRSISLSLDKIGQPDVSDGVKRLLGLYAWVIMQSAPDVTVTSTDIEDFIGEPRA